MTPWFVPNPPFSTTDHMISAQTHPILHHVNRLLPVIPRRSEACRGAKSTSFAPRIELSPGAHGRCNRVTCSAATTSVPRAAPPAISRFARLEKSPRFRHLLHRAQDAMAQNATQRIKPKTAYCLRRASFWLSTLDDPRPFRRSMDEPARKSTILTHMRLDDLWAEPS